MFNDFLCIVIVLGDVAYIDILQAEQITQMTFL